MSESVPSPRRWAWPAVVAAAVLWAAGLGTLAATDADEPTLNRAQLADADALVWGEVVGPAVVGRGGGGVRVRVIEAVRAGAPSVPPELTPEATVTVAAFPEGATAAGTRAAIPVRRVGRGWAVAAAPGGVPRLVYRGDWSGLKAAAAALAVGRDPYR